MTLSYQDASVEAISDAGKGAPSRGKVLREGRGAGNNDAVNTVAALSFLNNEAIGEEGTWGRHVTRGGDGWR
ncbi:hypothetical protein Sliba_78370 [Streptomyces nigrescens]|uniref:Uncharacterized protein n=1 Tax=Streptomyces nigrescens TaxID=1920 RepID=A0A640TW37_STRNI|nr:hypothetical protein Sliba_78370 [Streptomyces libani subsp. libani]GGV96293.1 hypothetical protein GCM10010500_38700 [Streptomyces libani subsp. libani]